MSWGSISEVHRCLLPNDLTWDDPQVKCSSCSTLKLFRGPRLKASGQCIDALLKNNTRWGWESRSLSSFVKAPAAQLL